MLQKEGIDVQMLTFNPLQLFFSKYYGIKSDISLLYEVHGENLGAMKEIPENKVELLREYCSRKAIDLTECAHVGDSLNDIETFRAVGFSIALNSSDAKVEREVTLPLRTYDFTDVANSILQANDLT